MSNPLEFIISAKDQASSVFESVGNAADSVRKTFESLYKPIDDLSEVLTEMKNEIVAAFEDMRAKVSAAIQEAFRPITFIAEVVSSTLGKIRDSFVSVYNGIKEFVVSLAESMAAPFIAVYDAVKSTMGKVQEIFLLPIQGLNAFADGIFAVQSSVSDFFDNSIFKLAKMGGAYDGQLSQFKNLAAAYSVDGEVILKVLDDISGGSITALDRIKIATKGVTTGLDKGQLESVLAFTKKYTEATGQSFADMSETVLQAMSAGKFSVLKQMGIFVEDGAKVGDVAKQMKEQIARFGTSAFATGDSIDTINTKMTDFVTFVGSAVNSSSAWQRVMQAVTGTVVDFVANFDYARVGDFFDKIIRTGEIVYVSLRKTFGDVFKTVWDTFANLGSKSGAEEFFTFMINNTLNFAKTVMNSFQFLGNTVIPVVITSFGTLLKASGEVFSFLEIGAKDAAKTFIDVIQETGIQFGLFYNKIASSGAGIAAGLSTVDMTPIILGLKDASKAIDATGSDIGKMLETSGKKIEEFGAGVSFDFGDRFANIAEKAKKDMESFKLPPMPIFDEYKPEEARAAIERQKNLREYDEKRKEIQSRAIEDLKAAKAQEFEIFKRDADDKLEIFKLEQEAAKLVQEASLSQEERDFRRKQEDLADKFKKELKDMTSFVDENGNGISFSGVIDMNSEQIQELRELTEKRFRREQEDQAEAFKKEQDKKKEDWKRQQEDDMIQRKKLMDEEESMMKRDADRKEKQAERDVKNSAGADSYKETRAKKDSDNLQKLADNATKQEEDAELKKNRPERAWKLILQPTGDSGLDYLVKTLLEKFSIQAEAEDVEVMAG